MDDLKHMWYSKGFTERVWFSATPEDDKRIYDCYGHYISAYNPENQDITMYPIQIVLLDQVTRHIDRHLGQPKTLAKMFAPHALRMALEIINEHYDDFFLTLPPQEQVMVLMPLRHTFERDYLEKSLKIINSLRDSTPDGKSNGFYRRFWNANVRSLGNLLPIEEYNPSCDPHPEWNFDSALICPTAEFDPTYPWNYPEQLRLNRNARHEKHWSNAFTNALGKPSDTGARMCDSSDFIATPDGVISLSGGTDSMVASYNLKRIGYNVIAVMVVYNNRDTSQVELEFVKWWCAKIGIRLFYRQITEIKKSRDSDREFYEAYTRELRFRLYRHVYDLFGKQIPIILGHNLDDTLENLFTNLRKSVKTDNLLGMCVFHEENGILIYRPMLEIWKNDIMEYARQHGIPYLYDSTPRDCWRGILRHQVVLPILNLERGDQILKSLHKLAKDMKFMVAQFNRHIVETTPITITLEGYIQIELIDYGDRNNFIYWDLLFENLTKEPYNLNKAKVGSIKSLVQRLEEIEIKNKQLKHTSHEIINLDSAFDGYIYQGYIEIRRRTLH